MMKHFRLGKTPAVPDSTKLRFARFFDARQLPTPPMSFGHYVLNKPWGMLANDRAGCCLAEGTEISGASINAAYKINYFGPMITISLASGKRLTVTPNHAILTTNGFATAKSIKYGDDLVSTSGTQIFPWLFTRGGQTNINYLPTKVDEIFSSLIVTGLPIRKIMPMAVDFYGDEKFFDGNVEVVRPNSFLRSEFYAALGQPHAQNKIRPTGQLKGLFIRAGTSFLASYRRLLAAYSNICLSSNRTSFRYAHAGIPQPQSLRLSSQCLPHSNNSLFEMAPRQTKLSAHGLESCTSSILTDCTANVTISPIARKFPNLSICPTELIANSIKPSCNGQRTDPNLFPHLCKAFPGLIEADRVVGIDVQRNCRAHVYDLSTDSRWYLANGVVTHNCVWSGASHETMIWGRKGYTPPDFTDSDVLDDYGAVTGFKPDDPSTDNGTDMTAAAKYRQKTGIKDAAGTRHKIDAYVALRVGNIDELALATYLTSAIGLGVQMPGSAEDQFNAMEPWSVVHGSHIEGGHYVPCFGRNKSGNFLVVTWGRLHAVEPAFLAAYMDEGIAYISLEALEHKLTPDGFDANGLRSALPQLGR